MKERTSKFLLALEAIFIAAPVTSFFLTLAPIAFSATLTMDRGRLAGLALLLLTTAGLVSGWMLMIRFWRMGSVGLKSGVRLAWSFSAAAAVAVVGSSALAWSNTPLGPHALKDHIGFLVLGSPLLVPLGHLVAERRRSNPSPQARTMQA